MKLAAIQHRLREDAEADARALADSALRAAATGADVILLPEVPSLGGGDGSARSLLYSLLDDVPAAYFAPRPDAATGCLAFVSEPLPGGDGLGRIGVAIGDACLDAGQHAALLAEAPDTLVLYPRSENDLQAEAVLELAISLSESLAGLVAIVECAGSVPGDPGHGGSAIVLLGEVVAEAIDDGDDVLVADVWAPLNVPEPREPLPAVPLILRQRLAHHRGEPVPHDYPADLS